MWRCRSSDVMVVVVAVYRYINAGRPAILALESTIITIITQVRGVTDILDLYSLLITCT